MIELILLIVDLLFIGMYRSAKRKYRESDNYDITRLTFNQMLLSSILIGITSGLLALFLFINALSSESYEQPARHKKAAPKTFQVYENSSAHPQDCFFLVDW